MKLTREEAAQAVTPYGLTPEQFVYLIRRNCTVAEAKVMLAAPQLLAALGKIENASRKFPSISAAGEINTMARDAIEEAAK